MSDVKIITQADLLGQEVKAEQRKKRKEVLEQLQDNPVYNNKYIKNIIDLYFKLEDELAVVDALIKKENEEMFKLNEKDAGNKEFFDKSRKRVESLADQKKDLVRLFKNQVEDYKTDYIRDIREWVVPKAEDLQTIQILQEIKLDDNQLIGYIEKHQDNGAVIKAIKDYLIENDRMNILQETDVRLVTADSKIKAMDMLCNQLVEAGKDNTSYMGRLVARDMNKYLGSYETELGSETI